jgi:hypothetical protein
MLGGWSISESLFNKIRYLCPTGGTILELGSGEGTAELIKYYKMYSIEDNAKYIGHYHNNYIHAELKEHKPIKNYTIEKYGESGKNIWYDANVLRVELPKIDYDLLLIDGPKSTRSGIVKYFDLFKHDVPIVLDDLHRTLERKILQDLSKIVKRPYTVYDAWAEKSFGVIL